jgi:hypothetical protein
MADSDNDDGGGESEPRRYEFKRTSKPISSIATRDPPPPAEDSKPLSPRHNTPTSVANKKETKDKKTKRCVDCQKRINLDRPKGSYLAFPCKHVCHQECATGIDGRLSCPRCLDDDSGDDIEESLHLEDRQILPLPSMDKVTQGPKVRALTHYRFSIALARDYDRQICYPHNARLLQEYQSGLITEAEVNQRAARTKNRLHFFFWPINMDVLLENKVRVSTLLDVDVNFKELFDTKMIEVLNDLTKLGLTLNDVTFNKDLLSVAMIDTKFPGLLRPEDFTMVDDKPFLLHMLECMTVPEPKKRLLAAEVQRLNVNILQHLKSKPIRRQMTQIRDLFIRSLRFITHDEWKKTLGLTDECLKLMKISATDLRSLTVGSASAMASAAMRKKRRTNKPYSDDGSSTKHSLRRHKHSESDDDDSSENDASSTDSD